MDEGTIRKADRPRGKGLTEEAVRQARREIAAEVIREMFGPAVVGYPPPEALTVPELMRLLAGRLRRVLP